LYDWLISTAVWARDAPLFVNYTLPAIRIAAQNLSGNVRIAVHTDTFKVITPLLGPADIVRPVQHGKTNIIRLALPIARPCTWLGLANAAFINADMVASAEVFAAAEKQPPLARDL
jgi:hypothetical protein